ncbi:MAG: anti-sigma factor family protein [Pyrinomonadaceae bacterium]
MTEKCYDIGAMQAFLDGELAAEQSEAAARHISACDACAALLTEAEEETAFAFSVLEQEFNTLVPTQRLWAKINDSIERDKKSFWSGVFAFALRPSTAALASLLFVAAIFVALVSLKSDAPTNYVAQNETNKRPTTQATSEIQKVPAAQPPRNLPETGDKENAKSSSDKNEYRAVATTFRNEKIRPRNVSPKAKENVNPAIKESEVVSPKTNENVAGEESYIKTIATLTETVKNRKDVVLDSSARFAFERDLAITDDAIVKMRAEVKQNPNNEAAKQILRASYQNKIDLLDSVAEKNELMATLK